MSPVTGLEWIDVIRVLKLNNFRMQDEYTDMTICYAVCDLYAAIEQHLSIEDDLEIYLMSAQNGKFLDTDVVMRSNGLVLDIKRDGFCGEYTGMAKKLQDVIYSKRKECIEDLLIIINDEYCRKRKILSKYMILRTQRNRPF